ncbi:HMCN1 [Symbiodinium natans]|uniref:HMCN1 protein n=1 Tax=Symbiodinium natans TaxID=878477 RepID=A0A812RDW0_9DINO|nr:HMCN1 [Symbiodinium natans]
MDEAQSASSFYGSLFPRTRRGPSLPPIYAAAGGRSEAAKTADARPAAFDDLLTEVVQSPVVEASIGGLLLSAAGRFAGHPHHEHHDVVTGCIDKLQPGCTKTAAA